MNLYLVRHGQSEGNLARPGAPHDPALTHIGRAQAARVAQALASEPTVALYASPTTRALETASPIEEKLHIPIRVWPALAETSRLEWNSPKKPVVKRGLTPAEVRERFPQTELAGNVGKDEAWWEAHAGEGRAEAYARAAQALAALRRGHPGEDESIVVITHGAFGSVLLSTALGTPPTDYNRYSHYNCGISLLRCTDEEVRLCYLNSVEHLPTELRTDLT